MPYEATGSFPYRPISIRASPLNQGFNGEARILIGRYGNLLLQGVLTIRSLDFALAGNASLLRAQESNY